MSNELLKDRAFKENNEFCDTLLKPRFKRSLKRDFKEDYKSLLQEFEDGNFEKAFHQTRRLAVTLRFLKRLKTYKSLKIDLKIEE